MPDQVKLDELTNNLKSYANTNYELIKLKMVERLSVIGSGFTSGLITGLVGFLTIIFLSVGTGLYLSSYFGNYYEGFFAVAAFYFLAGLILLIGRKKILKAPLRDMIIKKAFSEN